MWRNCYSTKDFHSLFPSHYKIHSFVYKTKHISTLCIICIQDRIMPSKRGVLPSLRLGGIPTGNKVQKWLQNAVPPSILCNVTLKFHFAFFFPSRGRLLPLPLNLGSFVTRFGQWDVAATPEDNFQISCFYSYSWNLVTRDQVGASEKYRSLSPFLQRFWLTGSRDVHFYQASEAILIRKILR